MKIIFRLGSHGRWTGGSLENWGHWAGGSLGHFDGYPVDFKYAHDVLPPQPRLS